jgi:hypothetical protein
MTERGKKIREAFLKKYGVEHPSQLPSVKEKIKKKRESGAYDNMVEKIKKTKLEKYGDENYVNVEKNKKTKLEKYGDENYNNRDKMLKTNNEKYGMNISPNTLKSINERLEANEFGFNSEKFKNYLKQKNVENVSQIPEIKKIKKHKKIKESIAAIFDGDRLKNIVTPLFNTDEYKGSEYYTFYKFKCNVCKNEFEDNLYSGNIPRCLKCYPHNRFKSKIEDEILAFVKNLNLEVITHDRDILGGNEIDIYIPTLNLAIECDGIYWHSELSGGKNKQYHLEKTKKCLEKNIRLIHIWDYEWLNKKDIIKSIILSKIGKVEKIYARKCIIKEVNDFDKSNFLINNHIQGDDKSSIKIGLYYDNKLVSIMTFVKSRYDKKYQYEISRYCNILNTKIVGGASKIFSYFIKSYNPNSIITYSDMRLFDGGVYKNIGMNFVKITPPNYHYFDKNNCIPLTRISFQKHKLSRILKTFNSKLSEWENMQINGYDRIWDCGHFKYEWFKKTIDNV